MKNNLRPIERNIQNPQKILYSNLDSFLNKPEG